MASGVARVIERCEDAKETEKLDLSACQLMQMPDAIFHLMRHTIVRACDISNNVIVKIPAKLALQFSNITELNLSHNRIGKLPDEFGELESLLVLNISHNAFVSLPRPVYKLPKLEHLFADNNYIAEIDTALIKEQEALKTLSLEENPLTQECHNQLNAIKETIQIKVTPIVEEDLY